MKANTPQASGIIAGLSRPRSRQEPHSMQDRNVLSLIRRIAGAGLSAIALAVAAPTLAENADSVPLIPCSPLCSLSRSTAAWKMR
jgi:predicted secreted protein